ncbi:DUF3592 domain-containing protein [Kribbella sp. NPDC056861]|uniref:DUF3592 domain-containing protein n=1 Tax=Kribbella sp. NPDC056861 TaxID=3154857 RepID=UPI003422BF89
MTEDLTYPGRGGIWLGVPGLILLAVGVLVLGEFLYRQGYSREFVEHGVETTAESVQIRIHPKRAGVTGEDVVLVFHTASGQRITTSPRSADGETPDLPEGEHAPPAGTRYAMPLKILYAPADPTYVLASVDAREWAADRDTPLIGGGLLAGGGLLVSSAVVVLTRSARRRGVAWNRWFSE